MRRNEVVGLLVAIALFAILLSALILKEIVSTDRAIELIILFTLALATILYAQRTAEMANATKEQAKATKEQADASVKMAEEMREQTKTLKETVGLSIRPSFDMQIIGVKGSVSYEFEPPDEFIIRLDNIGKGPARGLFISCSGDGTLYSEEFLRNLNQGKYATFSIHRQTPLDQRPKVKQLLLTIIYLDELGDTLESSMPINCDGKNWKPGAITMIYDKEELL